jgi:hypothetical protein
MKTLTLKDIGTSRSLMQKFIKLADKKGFKYPGAIFLYSKRYGTWKVYQNDNFGIDDDEIPTYTLAEWMRILPDEIDDDGTIFRLSIIPNKKNYSIAYVHVDWGYSIYYNNGYTTNTCASTAIWLLENGYLK